MSYDYFLWRTNRRVSAGEIDETTVEPWADVNELRDRLIGLCPGMVWRSDGSSADDRGGRTAIRAIRLPSAAVDRDALVIRTSHRRRDTREIARLGEKLDCLVYDTQTGEIVWQPQGPGEDGSKNADSKKQIERGGSVSRG